METSNNLNPTPIKHQPRKSVEGWIVFATGIPPEAEPDDLERIFSEYGKIHSIHLNVDRRTGYLKGYALVEYENFKSAQEAINQLNDTEILDHKIKVDWCFLNPNDLVKRNLEFYNTIKQKNSVNRYTVIATINDYDTKELIALATGTQANLKCHPDDIEDCHAESLVKRAYKRYLIDRIGQMVSSSTSVDDLKFSVESLSTNLILFISQFPCGLIDRYEGKKAVTTIGPLRRKPGRGTFIDGKVVYVEKDDCVCKLLKWLSNGLQGHRMRHMLNIESKIKQVLIGNCENDESFDYKTYVEQLEQILQIDVDLVNCVRQDEYIFNPLKQAQPESIVWWTPVSDHTNKRPRDVKHGDNIEFIVDGHRRGLTKKQVSDVKRTTHKLNISTFRLNEDLDSIEQFLNSK